VALLAALVAPTWMSALPGVQLFQQACHQAGPLLQPVGKMHVAPTKRHDGLLLPYREESTGCVRARDKIAMLSSSGIALLAQRFWCMLVFLSCFFHVSLILLFVHLPLLLMGKAAAF
jgi:hypothetical protein